MAGYAMLLHPPTNFALPSFKVYLCREIVVLAMGPIPRRLLVMGICEVSYDSLDATHEDNLNLFLYASQGDAPSFRV